MKYRLKHKLAWWLRRWANKLEPQVCAPNVEAPIVYGQREYKINALKVAVYREPFEGQDFHDLQIIKAKRQVGEAVQKLIEARFNQPGPGGNNRTILQLLILTPKDNVYTSDV